MTSIKSPAAVRRIMKELQEMEQDRDTPQYRVTAVEDNLLELHFTISGPADSPYATGRYHGRILCPPEYPYQPPEILLLTVPSGRFEVNTKICLSATSFHPELWQPAWGIRTVLVGLMAFMATESEGAIGSLHWTDDERRALANQSGEWTCPTCAKSNVQLLAAVATQSECHAEPAQNTVPPLSRSRHTSISLEGLNLVTETVSAGDRTQPPVVVTAGVQQQKQQLDLLIVGIVAIVLALLCRRMV